MDLTRSQRGSQHKRSVPQLPTELWARIFSIVCEVYGRKRDIFSLARTCQRLWAIGQPALYSTVSYVGDPAELQGQRQWQAVASKPHLWQYIKLLELREGYVRQSWTARLDVQPPMLGTFPYLQELYLESVRLTPELVDGLMAASRLTSLAIIGMNDEVWDSSIPEDWTCGRFAPLLTTLKIRKMYSEYERDRRQPLSFLTPPSIRTLNIGAYPEMLDLIAERLLLGKLSFAQVETLILFAFVLRESDWPAVETIIQHCPKLRRLWLPPLTSAHPISLKDAQALEMVCVEPGAPAFKILREIPNLRSIQFNPSFSWPPDIESNPAMENITSLLMPTLHCAFHQLGRISTAFPNLEVLLMARNGEFANAPPINYLTTLTPFMSQLPRLRHFLIQFHTNDTPHAYPDGKLKEMVASIKREHCPHLERFKFQPQVLWSLDPVDETWSFSITDFSDQEEWEGPYCSRWHEPMLTDDWCR